MYAEIQAGLAALKTALELAKAGKGVIDQAEMASALYEVQSRLMEMQNAAMKAMEENAQLAQRVRLLEAGAAAIDDWKEEASQYVPTNVAEGVTTYTLANRNPAEPFRDAIKLCANCFSQRRKSILQLQSAPMRQRSLVCQSCKSELVFRRFADWQLEHGVE